MKRNKIIALGLGFTLGSSCLISNVNATENNKNGVNSEEKTMESTTTSTPGKEESTKEESTPGKEESTKEESTPGKEESTKEESTPDKTEKNELIQEDEDDEDIIQPEALKRLKRNLMGESPLFKINPNPSGTSERDMSVPNISYKEDESASAWVNGLKYSTGPRGGEPIPGTPYGFYQHKRSGAYKIDIFKAQINNTHNLYEAKKIEIKNTYTTYQTAVRYYIHYPISIADYTFNGMSNLEEVEIKEENQHWASNPAYVIDEEDRIKEIGSVRYIGNYAFKGTGLKKINLERVWNIGAHAFENLYLRHADLVSVRMIGNYAFYNNDIAYVNMPEVKQIGDYAFAENKEFTEIGNLNNLERIGAYAFKNANLKYIFLPTSLRTIGEHAFERAFNKKSYSTVYIPSSVVNIGNGAFAYNKRLYEINYNSTIVPLYFAYENSELTRLKVPKATKIGEYAFAKTGFFYGDFPETRTVGAHAFEASSIQTATFSNLVNLGEYAFARSSLTEFISTGNSPLTIDRYAFSDSSLRKATFSNLVNLGGYAFARSNLTEFISTGNSPLTVERYAFADSRVETATFSNLVNLEDNVFIMSNLTKFISTGNLPLTVQKNAFASSRVETATFSNLVNLGERAFAMSKLTKFISKGNSLLTINQYAFYQSDLLNANISGPVRLENNSFNGAYRLETVNIPKVSSIGEGTFSSAFRLKKLNLNGGVVINSSSRVFNYNTTVKINRLRESNGKDANWKSWGDPGKIEYVNSPFEFTKDSSDNITLTGLETGKGPEHLRIPDKFEKVGDDLTPSKEYNVVKIESHAFANYHSKNPSGQKLHSISFGRNITEIGEGAFANNPSLWKVSFYWADKLTEIKKDTFKNTDLRWFDSIVLPKNVKTVGDRAFQNTGMAILINSPNLITIGESAFADNLNLGTVILEGVTTIGAGAFANNPRLRELSLPKATTIGAGAFANNKELPTVSLPEAKTIGAGAFANNPKLTTVILPEVTTIGAGAFANNNELTTVILPKAVTIEADAFINCPKLTNIVLNGDVNITASTRVFDNNTIVKINRLRDDVKDANWEQWGNPTNIKYANSPFNYEKDIATGEITLTGFETGKEFALERNFFIPKEFEITEDKDNGINAVQYPIKKIKDNAFKDIANISASKITVPDSITEIGVNAFDNIGQTLEEVILPNTITILGAGAFANNSNLAKVNIPLNDSLTKIENDVFKNTALLNISIPNNITEIGDGTFENTKINGSILLSNVTKIGKKSFAENEDIISVIAPKLEIIDDAAFLNKTAKPTKLSTISIPNINSIGEDAFKNNINLKNTSLATNKRNKRSAEELPNVMPETLRTIKAGAFLQTGFDAIELNGQVQIKRGSVGNTEVFDNTTKVYINRVRDEDNFDVNERSWGGEVSYLNKPEFTTVYESNPNGTYKATITMTTPKKLVIDYVNKVINNPAITITESLDFVETSSNEELNQRTIVVDNIPYDKITDFTVNVISLTKNIFNKTWSINKKVDYLHKDGKAASNLSGRYYPDGFKTKIPEPNTVPSGKVFIGWSETKDAATSIYPIKKPVIVNGNITLYTIFADKSQELEVPTTTITEEKQEEKPSTTTEKSSEETTDVTTENKTETTMQFEDDEQKNKESTTQFIKDDELETTEITTTNTVVTDENGNIINQDNHLDISIDKDGNIVDESGNILIDKDGNIIDESGNISIDNEGNIIDENGDIIIDKNGNIYDNENNIIGTIKINTKLLFGQNENKELIELVESNKNSGGSNLDKEEKLITEKIYESLIKSLSKRGKQISETRKAENNPSIIQEISKFLIIIVSSIILSILAIYYARKKKSFNNDKKDLEI